MKASKPQLTDEPSLTKKTKTSAITYQKRHTCLNTTHWFIGWNFAISRFVTIPGIRYGTQKPSTTLEVSEQKVPVCRAHWAHHFVPTPEFEGKVSWIQPLLSLPFEVSDFPVHICILFVEIQRQRRSYNQMVGGAQVQKNQIPYMLTHKLENNYTIEVLPQEWKFWVPCQAPQPKGLAMGGEAPRESGFEGHWSLISGSLQDGGKKLHS